MTARNDEERVALPLSLPSTFRIFLLTASVYPFIDKSLCPHLVGIVDFLEALRGGSGTLVPVRVVSHRQPAVRPLDL